jgi:ribosomal protein S18 acetylase RimI-like enzyme
MPDGITGGLRSLRSLPPATLPAPLQGAFDFMQDFKIRKAQESDLPILGKLGASLVRTHYAFDPQRFIPPQPGLEEGYAWFLGNQMRESDAVIFVAEHSGSVVGYVYGEIEPYSWKELREPAGFIHDVVVNEADQHSGIGAALVEAAVQWFRDHGVPRVILWTAEQNGGAQRLFERLGFRRTMIEMTREITRSTE